MVSMPGSKVVQELESIYGEAIASYEGNGSLVIEGREIECTFGARQLPNGSIVLMCISGSNIPYQIDTSPIAFRGTTADNMDIEAEVQHRTRYALSLGEDAQESKAVYQLQSLSARSPDAGRPVHYLFKLTNCPIRFDLVRDFRIGDAQYRAVIGPACTLLELEDIKILRKVGITADLRITPAPPVEISIEVVRELCYVLSVAFGTRVEWIELESYNIAGEVLRRMHQPGICKPYTPIPLVNPKDQSSLNRIMAPGTFERFREHTCLLFDGQLIDAWLDARLEQDFLQLRAVKACVVAEMLTSSFVASVTGSESAFVMKEGDFESRVAPVLQTALTDLREQAPETMSAEDLNSLANYSKLSCLNRRSFASLLRKVCKFVGWAVPSKEVRLFAACRNKLVHEGQFYCNSASPEGRDELPPPETPTAEYFFLLSFLDKFLLNLLGYSGRFLDWSKWGSSDFEDSLEE